ncbi:MAG: tRNA 2-thiouridine(34) synthase MnmA [Lachnospiraceae bacterium]|nr:tRNA 2-thiouridine(34) synthase MnmA [Lachnospiraceae bacterium]
MSKVIVGMSGGVDSAVCAYLLKEQGHEVIGVTLRTWVSDEGEEGRCCEIDDARRVAGMIGITYHAFNCLSEFKKYVTDPFVEEYLKGLTPNPCVVCNRAIKWERMLYHADVLGADYVATGHYAYVVKKDNGRYSVKTARHAAKDQTYMLYRLGQDQLARTLMPLGDYSKDEVRSIALKAGIPVADKPDSQEICFVPDGHYTDYIRANTDRELPGEGDFVDEDGNVLGRHKGIFHYTVGQRKGLGLPLGYPAYVKEIDVTKNQIVIGDEASVMTDVIVCDRVNYMGIEGLEPGGKLKARTKIRYHHKAASSYVEGIDEDHVKITFEEPVKAPSPGQSAVFYDDEDCVIGGGTILRSRI